MEMDFNTILNTLISFINSPEIQVKVFPIKIVFLAASLLFAAFAVFMVFFGTHYMQWLIFQDAVEFLTRRPYGAKKIDKVWNRVLKRLDAGLESEYKLAIIEADNMMDSALKKMGYAGQTLEEKLGKLTSATLPNIEQIYQAHQLRNNIVYNPDFRLSPDEAKKNLNIYEQAFHDLLILT